MKTPDLGSLLQRFFTEHITAQRDLSPCTVRAYRDTFRLLLRFLQSTRRTTASQLSLEACCAQSVLAFLSHLEKDRHNCIRSRNARLAAIRAFVHYASDLLGPEIPEATRHILSIPQKRFSQSILGFLTRDEIKALLAMPDQSWTERRDHLLFLLLYNTGGRISEILGLRVGDVVANNGHYLTLHGKGRKERQIPIWRSTQRRLNRWIHENSSPPNAPLLPNRFGQQMTRSGVAWQLRKRVKEASVTSPTLRGRRISPHTFRHTTAMHLLQSGVAPEVIALWLGHNSPNTTHLYIEADLEMKSRTLAKLSAPHSKRTPLRHKDPLLQFLDSV
ncbi:site-specific integrase [soil metagenome]